jgi:hypothetical protein
LVSPEPRWPGITLSLAERLGCGTLRCFVSGNDQVMQV